MSPAATRPNASTSVRSRRLRALLGGSLAMMAPVWLLAEQPAMEHYRYRVAPGDTLIGVGGKLLRAPADWRRIQRLNAVADPRLLASRGWLNIPYDMLAAEPASARVSALTGKASLDGRPLEVGATLGPSQQVETHNDSFVTLSIDDGSSITLQPDSTLRVEKLQRYRNTDAFDIRLNLPAGKVETHVAPRPAGSGRYELRTPSAVIGVRGTRFRVASDRADQSRTEVTEGKVAARTDSARDKPVVIAEGFGLIVDAGQPLAQPVALLPPPSLADTPRERDRPVVRLPFGAVPQARAYRAQVARDGEFRDLLAESVVPAPEAKFAALDDGTYWLRVRGIDARGLEGRDAVTRFRLKARPLPPATLHPAPGAKAVASGLEFRWAEMESVARYVFQISRDQGFAPPHTESETVAASSLAPRRPLEPGEYRWRVASVRADGDQGPFGDPVRLVVRPPTAPASPPVMGEKDMALQWSGEPGQSFDLQLARDSGFGDVVASMHTTEPHATLARPDPGSYYLRIRAIDADGFTAPFSPPQRIEVPRPPFPWWVLLVYLLLL
ncbi:MAG: FecR domain-containing protein [Betaproteobacteria bacterium]|nr:FecR domain-containing protein [Betaproteobacteria bacterium]